MPAGDGGLGSALVGEKIIVGQRNLHVSKLLGEGGFSYVYLVKEITDPSTLSSSLHADPGKDDPPVRRTSGAGPKDEKKIPMVLKVTSIHSRAQRDIAEKEAKLLSRLSHPSIIKMYDTCYRTVPAASQGKGKAGAQKERPQHLILMEFCEGGHALDVCNRLAASNQRFDLPTLIIAFGQICNAVSYLHAQRPPIVHRDLKPVNFLVKNGAYKLCDFGSAVFGHVDLRTAKARAEAEEVIQKTTTQMFRAPEMVDLYMAKKLTQATDVWALGCCLYSLAFLQNCFEEGSNLAILSGKYTIPEDNPYGEGLVELLDRMLTADSKARADMTEVILCLSAVYSGRPLPPRKRSSRAPSKTENQDGEADPDTKEEEQKEDKARVGTYRTDGQGIQQPVYDPTKATEGKKLASNSVAARRKRAAAAQAPVVPTSASNTAVAAAPNSSVVDPLDFSSFGDEGKDNGAAAAAFASDVGFGEMKGFETKEAANEADFFGSFDQVPTTSGNEGEGFDAAFDATAWGDGARSNDTDDGLHDAPPSGMDPQEHSDSYDDALKKDRPRAKRAGGGGVAGSGNRGVRSSRGGVEAGVEALTLSDAGDPSKDSQDRKSRSTKPDGGRPSSNSRSSRRDKPRSMRSERNDGPNDEPAPPEDKDRKAAPSKGTSFKKMFSRPKAPAPDP